MFEDHGFSAIQFGGICDRSLEGRSIFIGMNGASIVHTVLQTRCLRGAAKTRIIIDSIMNHNSFLTAFFDICCTKLHTKDVYTHLCL